MRSLEYSNYEHFELNNWKIEIDYGYIDHPLFPGNTEFRNDATRTSGFLRRVKLIKNNILINEKIENNPHYCSRKEELKYETSWERKGDELKREIYFDNGYIFKIEYWFSKNKQEPNRGIYYSKFRKLILYNSNNEIISEIIEENPNYRNPEIIYEIDEDLF